MKSRYVLLELLRPELLSERRLHLLACDFAEEVLPLADDRRSAEAIRVKRLWVAEAATDEELRVAREAAEKAGWVPGRPLECGRYCDAAVAARSWAAWAAAYAAQKNPRAAATEAACAADNASAWEATRTAGAAEAHAAWRKARTEKERAYIASHATAWEASWEAKVASGKAKKRKSNDQLFKLLVALTDERESGRS